MSRDLTQSEAKEVAEKLKKAYKFGTKKCPSWFKAVSIAMNQKGYYDVEVCIPGWDAVGNEEFNLMLEPFEGVGIHMRVVTEAKKLNFDKKVKEK